MTPQPHRTYREEIYRQYATAYKRHWLARDSRPEEVWARASINRLEDWLPGDKNAKCLDLGCGSGDFLHALRSLGYTDVIGIDVSQESVSIARTRGLEVVQVDVRDYLGRCDQYFDLICAFDVIEHFSKDEILDVLRKIVGQLAPGGIFILQTPNALSPWACHYRYGDLTHELIFSPECLESTLRFVGFANVEMREVAPDIHGLKSAIRWCLWKLIWSSCALWNLVETGSLNGGIYARNMTLRAIKEYRGG